MTAGRDAGRTPQPSWEQLLTGAHPSFRMPGRSGRAVVPRHGRDGWGEDRWSDDALDLGPLPDDDSMGWADAAAWTAVVAGLAVLLVSRLGELVH